jgi:hypothetical protein
MGSGKVSAVKRDREKRRPCQAPAEVTATPESWLGLEDDELLHRIETLGSEDRADRRLMEVVTSDRHFFVRQEAAKRVRDPHLLVGFEGDRHIGQILVRHLNRLEDLAYLERLVASSQHLEVRKAATAQLELLRRRLEETGAVPRLKLDEAQAQPRDLGIDGSLLGWALHFVVEWAWAYLGTESTRHLLLATQAELLTKHPSLNLFRVHGDARVAVDLSGGGRLPREAVTAVATWVQAFRGRVHRMVPDAKVISVREMTRLMAGPFEDVGLYAACDAIEAKRRA